MSKQQDKETLDEQLNEAQAMAENTDQEQAETTDNQSTEQDNEAKLMQERDELRDKYLRLMAEFDNFKKRNIRERMDLMNTAARDTMTALLPVLDDFDRAAKNGELAEGTVLIHQKLTNTLKNKGLQSLEVQIGDPFNADKHEAVAEIPAANEDAKGNIVDILEQGYTLGSKIIRHAKVVVGK